MEDLGEPGPDIFVVMGVCGCGKTTIGRGLAEALDGSFFDGDDYHPEANVAKMSLGEALSDEDREGWLLKLRALIESRAGTSEPSFIACSALKKSYRDLLRGADGKVQFIFLTAPREVLEARMNQRDGHFMPPALLDSQLETLEFPETAIVADVSGSPASIVEGLVSEIGL